MKGKLPKILGALVVVLAVAVIAVPGLLDQVVNRGKDLLRGGDLDPATAQARLADMVTEVQWREDFVTGVSTTAAPVEDLAATLPDIDTFPLVVDPGRKGPGIAEIFVSTEKSGKGDDAWMAEAALAFNQSGIRLSNGSTAQVAIRSIASGTGYQFIASGVYRPDAYSPSNVLWIEMARERGGAMPILADRTARNLAGIVMKEDVAAELEAAGQLDVPGIVDAVVQGRLTVGYSDPFASSTGLNFLISVLTRFSGGDPSALLSPEAVSAFESFQARVPFIALTTLQMRESVRRDGSLDAFVMEWQTFAKVDELRSGYRFIPFGWPHDNPLAAVGEPDALTVETLEAFAAFLTGAEQQSVAERFGFAPPMQHTSPGPLPDGARLVRAQKTWKSRKNAARPIAAMFVADVSGSMAGSRIAQLRTALREGASFILPENAIGLVTFSSDVTLRVPIKPFTSLHNATFQTAVERMSAGGNTAMYDAIAIALQQLLAYQASTPDVQPMVFVLTDGETNRGLDYSSLASTLKGLAIPIYTIGFEADVAELDRLSSTVEAASIRANEQNVRYQIGRMFNSQM
ncbi:MAG: VWA domain-containing protein [Pseudomonadota bacterium]